MTIDINNLSESELRELNHRIVERLRMIYQLKAHQAMLEFNIGELVCFYDNYGDETFATITKYNKKTVSLVSDDGRQWKVTPSLLRKVNDDPLNVTPRPLRLGDF